MKNTEILAQLEATNKQLTAITSTLNNLKTVIEESQEQEVDSSFIEEYHYFPNSEVLCIQFKKGSLWSYKNVSSVDYTAFSNLCRELDSCGKAYNKIIKGQYTSEQINW